MGMFVELLGKSLKSCARAAGYEGIPFEARHADSGESIENEAIIEYFGTTVPGSRNIISTHGWHGILQWN